MRDTIGKLWVQTRSAPTFWYNILCVLILVTRKLPVVCWHSTCQMTALLSELSIFWFVWIRRFIGNCFRPTVGPGSKFDQQGVFWLKVPGLGSISGTVIPRLPLYASHIRLNARDFALSEVHINLTVQKRLSLSGLHCSSRLNSYISEFNPAPKRYCRLRCGYSLSHAISQRRQHSITNGRVEG